MKLLDRCRAALAGPIWITGCFITAFGFALFAAPSSNIALAQTDASAEPKTSTQQPGGTKQTGQPSSASQAYTDYYRAIIGFSQPEDILPFLASTNEGLTIPADEQQEMLEMMQSIYAGASNFSILSETVTGQQATVMAETYDPDGTRYELTATLVLEGGDWRLVNESWVGAYTAPDNVYGDCADACYALAETGSAQCEADVQNDEASNLSCQQFEWSMADQCIVQCQIDYPEAFQNY